MINFEIVIHPSALLDIDDIASWYFIRSPKAELQFYNKLNVAFDKLAKNPTAFSRINKNTSIRSCITEKYPYKVYFRLQDNLVEILAIIHTSRSTRYIRRRLK